MTVRYPRARALARSLVGVTPVRYISEMAIHFTSVRSAPVDLFLYLLRLLTFRNQVSSGLSYVAAAWPRESGRGLEVCLEDVQQPAAYYPTVYTFPGGGGGGGGGGVCYGLSRYLQMGAESTAREPSPGRRRRQRPGRQIRRVVDRKKKAKEIEEYSHC